MVTRLLIVYFLILFVSSQATLRQSNIFAQQSTSDAVKIESKGKDLSEGGSSQDELLLKYVEFFSNEADKHRTYLNWLYSILAGVITVLLGAIAWFNKRSRDEIRKSVDETFHREIKGQFEKKLEDLQDYVSKLAGLTDSSHSYFKALAHVIVVTSSIRNVQESFDERKLINKKILWVDDKQYNIGDYKILLESLKVNVTPAKTTAETVKHLESNKSFDLIITNLGRDEDGGEKAGLDLLKKDIAMQIPIVIFTRQDNIDRYGTEALNLGARRIVSGFSGILNAIVDILAR